MILYKIVFRNIVRYSRRSFAIGVAVFISILALQFLDSFGEGFKKGAVKMLLENEGVILITPEHYNIMEFAVHPLTNYKSIGKYIENHIPEARIEPSIEFPAVVSNDTFSLNMFVTATGYNSQEIKNIAKNIVEGRVVKNKGEMIIGQSAAGLLHCKIGDTLVILTTDRYGSMGIKEIKVAGIYKTLNRKYDEKMVIIHLNDAQFLLGWDKGEVGKIKANFPNYKLAQPFAQDIQHKFPDIDVKPWQVRLKNIGVLLRTSDIKMAIFIAIIMIVAAGIIVNTVLTSVLERKREIGTLRAIGTFQKELSFIVFGEVILTSITAAVIGTIVSFFMVHYLSIHGIYIGEISGIATYMAERIYPAIVWYKWVTNILFSLLWASIAALYPVMICVKMKPVDALRR